MELTMFSEEDEHFLSVFWFFSCIYAIFFLPLQSKYQYYPKNILFMKINLSFFSMLATGLMMASCGQNVQSSRVLVTSEAGDKCTEGNAVWFKQNKSAEGATFVISPSDKRQIIEGFGASLTESSAFVLACMEADQRNQILQEMFSEDGANFAVVRTHIGACDFSVEGKYSLCEQDGDTALLSFSLDRDKEGFSREQYPQITDEHYDLYHLMKDVAAIKAEQQDSTYRIIANTWTAPDWMKDNKKYYERENGVARGGALLPEYYQTYANYLIKYLEAYKEEGIHFWALTPVNEPMGNDGGWESMDFSPSVEAHFIGNYMGPTMAEKGFGDVKIFGFDQNIFEMGPYTAAIYGDSLANSYCDGMAIHWYGSTFSCFPNVLDSVHALYPDKILYHTEGCIDNLGRPGWPGVSDYDGYQEENWFNNDSFWWNKEATDWAYSTPWWPELHPAYSAVHRYAEYIIDGLNHWMGGFVDWNIVLDSVGGPNHVLNYCGAPVMVDYANDIVYYTPYYYALKQFSLSMRPGDVALGVAGSDDDVHLCAVENADGTIAINALNTSKEAKKVPVYIEGGKGYSATLEMPANSVVTVQVKL